MAKYATLPSPYANIKFKPVTGTILFDVGEKLKSFSVEILDDDRFNATLEFGIGLSDPMGCELGLYLFQTRIKIVDNDVFPTNKFAKETRSDPTTKSWQVGRSVPMMKEYAKFTLKFTHGWKKLFLFHQLKNVFFVVKIFVSKILVDDVLYENKMSEAEGLRSIAMLIAVLIFPAAIIRVLDFRATYWKVEEIARTVLQENLMRKFLNYDESLRKEISVAEFTHAITHDSFFLVHNGFLKMFDLAECVGRVSAMIVVQIYLAVASGSTHLIFATCALILFPV